MWNISSGLLQQLGRGGVPFPRKDCLIKLMLKYQKRNEYSAKGGISQIRLFPNFMLQKSSISKNRLFGKIGVKICNIASFS